ncbi:MAG: Pvc16 family protein [Anaerolineae bacterium]
MTRTETAKNSSHKLSIWLYQVTENEFLKNQPPLRVNGTDDRQRQPPLALNLYYLVTPFTGESMMDYLLLGKTMQVFYENAIIPLRSSGDEVSGLHSHSAASRWKNSRASGRRSRSRTACRSAIRCASTGHRTRERPDAARRITSQRDSYHEMPQPNEWATP